VREITVCGKTGTAQNHKKVKDKKVQTYRDHSVFIGFAPKENPKIAIAVYVEYAGFGGTYAAPIAGLMIEKYLHGEVLDKKKEEYYKNAVIEKNQPIYWVSPKPQ
jgi:penicillin-binding protein 2